MDERECWEDRYEGQELLHGERASDFLSEHADALPASGIALDLAAGEGRNAVFLARRGLEVIALDISFNAMAKLRDRARGESLEVDVAVCDLSQAVIPPSSVDVIINFNYLQRSLADGMTRGLKPGGVLFFETMTVDHLRNRPDFRREFLLARGELAAMFSSLRLLKYRETDIRIAGGGTRSVASLIAVKD